MNGYVASLMFADVIPPTLSCTNSPTSQHSNDYTFKPFSNHSILLITHKTHSIHTQDLIKPYTQRTLIKSFTIHRDVLKTIADNNMERCDDPVTMVKESMKAQFPKHYIIAQPHELTQLRALVEPVTLRRQETGPRSESVTVVTPRVDDDGNG